MFLPVPEPPAKPLCHNRSVHSSASKLLTRTLLIVTNPRRGLQTPPHSTTVLESAWDTTHLSTGWSNALLSFICTEKRQSKISSNKGPRSLMASRSLQQPTDSNWLMHTPQCHSGRTLPLPPRSLKNLKDWICLRTGCRLKQKKRSLVEIVTRKVIPPKHGIGCGGFLPLDDKVF